MLMYPVSVSVMLLIRRPASLLPALPGCHASLQGTPLRDHYGDDGCAFAVAALVNRRVTTAATGCIAALIIGLNGYLLYAAFGGG